MLKQLCFNSCQINVVEKHVPLTFGALEELKSERNRNTAHSNMHYSTAGQSVQYLAEVHRTVLSADIPFPIWTC